MKPFIYTKSVCPLASIQSLGLVHVVGLIFTACVFLLASHRVATAQTVHIPDPNLRTALELALGKEAGDDITETDMASLESLDAFESGILDLIGIEFATNLTELHLGLNAIANVTPLKNLTKLTHLDLHRNQRIRDVSPLKGL